MNCQHSLRVDLKIAFSPLIYRLNFRYCAGFKVIFTGPSTIFYIDFSPNLHASPDPRHPPTRCRRANGRKRRFCHTGTRCRVRAIRPRHVYDRSTSVSLSRPQKIKRLDVGATRAHFISPSRHPFVVPKH